MSAFLHKIDKAAAEELLLADGGDSVPGKFLIRPKGSSSTSKIISVIYKGQPTHHGLEQPDGEGTEWTVNKKSTGANDLDGVHEFLKSAHKFWPVPLVQGVPGSHSVVAKAPASPDVGSPTGASSDGEMTAWFHGALNKADADSLLLADGGASETGKFLLRGKAGSTDSFILSCIFKGQATHHAVARPGPGGEFTVNKKGTGCSSLGDVIDYLRTKRPPAWPLELTNGVAGPTATNDETSNAKDTPPQTPPASTPPASVPEPEPVVTASAPLTSIENNEEFGPNYHGMMTKSEAESLLLADNGAENPGKFLFRAAKDPGCSILCVVYKGKATYHNVVPNDGKLSVNKVPTPASTLVDLTQYLRKKNPKWPVPLTTAVPNPIARAESRTEPAVTAAAPVPAVAVTAQDDASDAGPMTAWFHGVMNKTDAEALLKANNGLKVSGKFLLRLKSAASDNDFVLSVVYKGTVTHHSVVRKTEGGELFVNKSASGCTDLASVVRKYRSKQPKWPVPLTDGVPGIKQPDTGKVTNLNKNKSGSGPLGFDDWAAPGNIQVTAPIKPQDHNKSSEPGKNHAEGIQVKKRSWITGTWRRKKLQDLADKPGEFMGNALAAPEPIPGLDTSPNRRRPSAQDIFNQTPVFQGGFEITGAAARRMRMASQNSAHEEV